MVRVIEIARCATGIGYRSLPADHTITSPEFRQMGKAINDVTERSDSVIEAIQRLEDALRRRK